MIFAARSSSRPSLIGTLLRWQLGAMATLWALLIVALILMMTRLENGDLDQRLRYFGQLLAQAASNGDPSPPALAQRVQAVEEVFVGGLIGELESVQGYVARYAVLTPTQEVLYAVPGFDPAWAVQMGTSRVAVGGETWHLVRQRSADGRFEVVVGESAQTRSAAMWPMLRIIGGSQLLIFSACVICLWLAARRSLAPLREAAAAIASRPTGALEAIPLRDVPREIAPLIAEIDALLARERERLDLERGFLADAAHELRTPVAALRVQMHLLTDAVKAAEHPIVEELQQGLDRIAHLLDQLLVMARAESAAGGPGFEKAEIEVSEPLRQRMAMLVPAARARDIQLGLDAPEHCTVCMSHFGLTAILDNVLDNAVRYSPVGGEVRVAVRPQGDVIRITIEDQGPGLTQAQRERVFDRFYRIPREGTTGTGLGLAIVRRMATREGVSISIHDGRDGRGLSFAIDLRRCIPAPCPRVGNSDTAQ